MNYIIMSGALESERRIFGTRPPGEHGGENPLR